jgi:hypothetical protein
LNPHVKVTALPARLTADNARAMAGSFDVVVDGSDNFATRYAVSDACYYEKRPLVTAGVGAFELPVGSSQSTERNCRHRIIEGVARKGRDGGGASQNLSFQVFLRGAGGG